MLQVLDQVRSAVDRWPPEVRAVALPMTHVRNIQRRLARVTADAALPPAAAPVPTPTPTRTRRGKRP